MHAYSVAWSRDEVEQVAAFADKVIFNSASQLRTFHPLVEHLVVGVRVNPGLSHSHYDLADPARRFSRLGITDADELREVAPLVSGLMFHFNCENGDVDDLARSLARIGERYANVLHRMDWISLGGGISFTSDDFDLDRFCDLLADTAALRGADLSGARRGRRHPDRRARHLRARRGAQRAARRDRRRLDRGAHARPPDLRHHAGDRVPPPGAHRTLVAGRTCLAGDSFGDHSLGAPLAVGDEVRFADAAGYTMVKANWFNGVPRPSIVVRRLDGSIDVVREFSYEDFRSNLS
ncbi:MAG: hypothetical protein R2713_04140 [Ilumatobacteraceae bacterium]